MYIFTCYLLVALLGFSFGLPDGFVYLNQIDPTIIQSVMYYSERNFIGQRIDGYKAPKIIVTEKAALKLKQIQNDIRNDNYSLVIYDSYRPMKAIEHFIRWSDSADKKMKPFYYPYISKKDMFKLGYISKKSNHNRGSTVDLTIIEIGRTIDTHPKTVKRELNDGRFIYFWQDNTVDMYSSVDLADMASWHDSTLIDGIYQTNRNYLRDKMEAYGFEPNPHEWWHYKLIDEPFKNGTFNFDVE